MSVPGVVMIDTCIFDEAALNFSSERFAAFSTAANDRGVRLLLPNVTEAEIRRHIAEAARTAVDALRQAQRKAPYLTRWNRWPLGTMGLPEYEIRQLVEKDFDDFLKGFATTHLGYEDVDIGRIMEWYSSQVPPFGDGRRKEFPDAIAFSCVLEYCRKNGCVAAIVTKDEGLVAAANADKAMVHFASLPSYTQALIDSDGSVGKLWESIVASSAMLVEAVIDELEASGYYPEPEPDGDVEDVKIADLRDLDFAVISVGQDQCAISFSGVADLTASVSYPDPDTASIDSSEDFYMPHFEKYGEIEAVVRVSGTAKIAFNKDSREVTGLDHILMDENTYGLAFETGALQMRRL